MRPFDRLDRKMESTAYLMPLLIFYSLSLVLPYIYMLRMSFNEFNSLTLYNETWSTINYWNIVTEAYYYNLLARTLYLGLVVTLITLILGYPLAMLIMQSGPRGKAILLAIVLSPMLINLVIRTYAWIAILGQQGLVNTLLLSFGIVDAPVRLTDNFFAVVVGLVHIYLPLMVISLSAVMERIDRSLLDVSESLGASGFYTWYKVLVPLSVPGIGVGSLLVFCHAISAFVTPALLGGGKVSTVATVIYEKFTVAINWPLGASLVFVLLVVNFAVIAAHGKFFGRR